MNESLFITEEGDSSFYLLEIEGFKVLDRGRLLGEIIGFGSNSVQDLIVVQVGQIKIEIPLVEAFLETIEFELREVHMNLPDGLIEAQSPKESK